MGTAGSCWHSETYTRCVRRSALLIVRYRYRTFENGQYTSPFCLRFLAEHLQRYQTPL